MRPLTIYAAFYITVENLLMSAAKALGCEDMITRVRMAKEAQKAQKVEMLISNIKSCRTAYKLTTCKHLYELILMQYPELQNGTKKIIENCFRKQEETIKNNK